MDSIEPTLKQLHELTNLEETPIVLVNLLKYKEEAIYPEGFDAEPCSGRIAYLTRFGIEVGKLVESIGGKVHAALSVEMVFIGPEEEYWDDVTIVEYPSPSAFFKLISGPEHKALTPHQHAALEDYRIMITKRFA